MEVTSLKQAFQGMVNADVIVQEAKVTNANTIEIVPLNDERIILDEDDLFLPEHIKIETGDIVYILTCNKGENYFVLGKKG